MDGANPKLDADVVIVGAGIIGSACACLLAQAGLRVVVLESGMRQLNSLKNNDPRIFAISIASRRILERAGAWRRLPDEEIGPYREMHVWDEQGLGEIRFDSAQVCEPTLGYIIPYRAIADALQERILEMDNIRCLWSVTPSAIRTEPRNISVTTGDGLQFRARLLIAADGSNSGVRKLANINYLKHDYGQSALACTVTTELPHKQVARQRFLRRGPLAFLPMANAYQSAIVWSSSPEHVQRLLAHDDAAFHFELAESFANELGSITSSGERVVFPLSRAQAEHYTRPRLALIGDSAHTIHPLAGLGANLGLLDMATLVEVVLEAHARGRDFGRHPVLRRYERWRKGENRNMLYLMDAFKLLFENRNPSLAWLRNAGLDIVDGLPMVKQAIMKRAMGLQGNLPALLR